MIYISDLLTGGISDLYENINKEEIINKLKLKKYDSSLKEDFYWDLFINEIKANLHIVLCFPPIGDSLKKQVDKFPALINNTHINWIQPWKQDSLIYIAESFIKNIKFEDFNSEIVVKFMAYSFEIINKLSEEFYEKEKRKIYNTNESFIQMICKFISILNNKKNCNKNQREKYQSGLIKIEKSHKNLIELKQKIIKAPNNEKKLEICENLLINLDLEIKRWQKIMKELIKNSQEIIGNALISSSFITFAGPFNKFYRENLFKDNIMNYIQKNNIPFTKTENIANLLNNNEEIANWIKQGLPDDSFNKENASILINTDKVPLLIDPQFQGKNWIQQREKSNNNVICLINNNDKNLIQEISLAIINGYCVIIDNIENNINSILLPLVKLIGRQKEGKKSSCNKINKINFNDNFIDFNSNFRLFLINKLNNPCFSNEFQREISLINFVISEEILERQLINLILNLNKENDLIQTKEIISDQIITFENNLKQLENSIIEKLTNIKGNILDEEILIENLNKTSNISLNLINKNKELINIEEKFNEIFYNSFYKKIALRGTVIYFILLNLQSLNSLYKYSLKNYFNLIISTIKAEEKIINSENTDEFIDLITYSAYKNTIIGLFERDILTFTSLLCFKILIQNNKLPLEEFSCLIISSTQEINFSLKKIPENLKKLLNIKNWHFCQILQEKIPVFSNFCENLEKDALKLYEFINKEEINEKNIINLPDNYKDLSNFQRLLLLKVLIPDKFLPALNLFIKINLGEKYIQKKPAFNIKEIYSNSCKNKPILFILTPDFDPILQIEKLANEKDFKPNFTKILMGQGQLIKAKTALLEAIKEGFWVLLHYINFYELTVLTALEEFFQLEITKNCHENFRLFITTEAPFKPLIEIIPEGFLLNSIVIIHEINQGDLTSNFNKVYLNDNKALEENLPFNKEFKKITFGLCYLHSLLINRMKYNNLGFFTLNYSFNFEDLSSCVKILYNYVTKYEEIPYIELRYLFSEVIYGGNIIDCWDRRINNAYFQIYIQKELIDKICCSINYNTVDFNIDHCINFVGNILSNDEIPVNLLGVHSNALIKNEEKKSDFLVNSLLEIQGKNYDSNLIFNILEEFNSRIINEYSIEELRLKSNRISPFDLFCIQECEKMNILIKEIKKNLLEIKLSLNVNLLIIIISNLI